MQVGHVTPGYPPQRNLRSPLSGVFGPAAGDDVGHLPVKLRRDSRRDLLHPKYSISTLSLSLACFNINYDKNGKPDPRVAGDLDAGLSYALSLSLSLSLPPSLSLSISSSPRDGKNVKETERDGTRENEREREREGERERE